MPFSHFPATQITPTQNTINGTTTPSHTYQYDKLDRLSDWLLSTPNSSNTRWTYDPNHNRTSQVQNTSVQQSTTLSPTSNRVSAFNTSAPSYNNAGSLTQDSSRKYTYNGLERISLIQNLSTTTLMAASYNGLGQRHWKSSSFGNTRYTYDEQGHATGEYTYGSLPAANSQQRPSGAQETLWLGDTPVAILDSTPSTPAPINSNTGNAARLIHTEEAFYQASERRQNAAFLSRETRRLCLINKRFERKNNKVMPSAAIEKKPRPSEHPKHITSTTGAILWTWQGDPFGNSQPSQASISPAMSNAQIGATAQGYTYNQRFAGQTYDKETGLYYNYFRHYDPATGRYVEADPIGLEGGWNRYAYVGGMPTRAVDPRGLATRVCGTIGRPGKPGRPIPCSEKLPPPPPQPQKCEEKCKQSLQFCDSATDVFPALVALSTSFYGRGFGGTGWGASTTAAGAGASLAGINQRGLYKGCQVGYERCKKKCDKCTGESNE